jgi:endoribonuclease Dicer
MSGIAGDSFLKYLSTIYVFVTNPSQNEGAMHIARQRIISNKALLHSAVPTGLPSFIQAKPFAIRTWQPPNFSVAPTPFHASGDSADVNPISLEEGSQHRADANDGCMQDVATQAPGQTEDEQETPRGKSLRRRKDDHDTHWLGNKVLSSMTILVLC